MQDGSQQSPRPSTNQHLIFSLFLQSNLRTMPLHEHKSYFSSHFCKGSEGSYDWKMRNCIFSDVCYNRTTRKLLYFSNHTESAIPILQDEGLILHMFPEKFIDYRGGVPEHSRPIELQAIEQVFRTRPREYDELYYNTQNSSSGLSVLYKPFWPENFGHFIADDLFALFSGMCMFGELSDDVHVLFIGQGCAEVHQQGSSEAKRCEKFFSSLWMRGISKHPVRNLADNVVFPQPVVCFQKLLVGIGNLAFHAGTHGRGPDLWLFRNWMLLNMGFPISPATAPTDRKTPILTVIHKPVSSNHPRVILNFAQLIEHLNQSLRTEAQVKVLSIEHASAEQQVLSALETQVAITPEGGVSFWALFLPFGSACIFIDHFNPQTNFSEHMEGFFWKDVPWIRDLYYTTSREEVILVIVSLYSHLSKTHYIGFIQYF